VTFAPSATIGGLITFTGIIMGNMAISRIIDAYENSLSGRRETGEMFLTGEVANPSNKRVEAGKWYRKTYPGGPLLKMLRYGQGLTVTGFLVMFALLAI
jgi:predicted lysophospholipase L1 biosynthesis ABC-type transport system permease subunit